MISDTLNELSTWFEEPAENPVRSTLLSKMALLELCGWIECELDRLVMATESGRLNDPSWVTVHVIKRTNGFHYDNHFRQMLVKIVGEVFVRRIETQLENSNPGDLERLKNLLGKLWRMRCELAHVNVGAVVPQQIIYQAPSWSNGQYQDISQLLTNFERALMHIVNPL